MHLVNLVRFRNQSLALLQEIASRIHEFQVDIHMDLMAKYFQLFVGTAQLFILSAGLPSLQEYAIIYIYAWEISKPQLNEHWNDVRDYIEETAQPIRSLREVFENLGFHLGQALTKIAALFAMSLNVADLWSNNCFNLIHTICYYFDGS